MAPGKKVKAPFDEILLEPEFFQPPKVCSSRKPPVGELQSIHYGIDSESSVFSFDAPFHDEFIPRVHATKSMGN